MEAPTPWYESKAILNAIEQAQVFLREMGEFFPYATVIEPDGEVRPLALYAEGDELDPIWMSGKLHELLEKELDQGKIDGYVICVNVLVREPDNGIKVDAASLQLVQRGHHTVTYYLKYQGVGKGMRFSEPFAL